MRYLVLLLTVVSATAQSPVPLQYHGGPVMTGPNTVYLIWYGRFLSSNTRPIIEYLLSNMGGTAMMSPLATYTNAAGTPISTALTFGGSYFDTNRSSGTALGQTVSPIVERAITVLGAPRSANAIYMVIGDSSTTTSQSSAGAWHSSYTDGSGNLIKYGIVQSLWNGGVPSNPNNSDSDSQLIAYPLIHEIREIITDPNGLGWINNITGDEVDDMCQGRSTTTATSPIGSTYNYHLGTYYYLIYLTWVNRGYVQGHTPLPCYGGLNPQPPPPSGLLLRP